MTIKIDNVAGEVYYSVKDLVNLLSLTDLTIRNYLRRKKLKGQKVGKFWYVSKENLKTFLEGNKKKRFLGVF